MRDEGEEGGSGLAPDSSGAALVGPVAGARFAAVRACYAPEDSSPDASKQNGLEV